MPRQAGAAFQGQGARGEGQEARSEKRSSNAAAPFSSLAPRLSPLLSTQSAPGGGGLLCVQSMNSASVSLPSWSMSHLPKFFDRNGSPETSSVSSQPLLPRS